MNKFKVVLSSNLNSGETVSIGFLVNSPMNENQLKKYYEYKSLSISNVIVEKI